LLIPPHPPLEKEGKASPPFEKACPLAGRGGREGFKKVVSND